MPPCLVRQNHWVMRDWLGRVQRAAGSNQRSHKKKGNSMDTPFGHQRMYQKIAAHIRKQIENGEYAPGQALPGERDLAKQLQVSRTSVREAVIALEVSGLVEVKTGSGVYVKSAQSVRPVEPQQPADSELAPFLGEQEEIAPFSLLQARLLIEPEAAALAAENMTPQALAQIQEAYMMNVSDNVMRSTTHVGDRLFHIRIAESSGNDAYAVMIRHLLSHRGQLFSTLQRLYTPEDMPLRSQQEHLLILRALEAGDAAAARQAMAQHLRNVIEIFTRSEQGEE